VTSRQHGVYVLAENDLVRSARRVSTTVWRIKPAAACTMRVPVLLSIHLAVAVPLERVRLEAVSAVNLCIGPVGTNSTGSEKKAVRQTRQ